LTTPVFLCYPSVRPIGISGCFITPLSLDACPPVAGEREGLSAVALAKAEVRVKKALADLSPSGPCSPLDPFGGGTSIAASA